MKLLFLLFLPLFAAMSITSEVNAYDLHELRRRYRQAADDAAASAALHKWLTSATAHHGAVVLAYRASSEALEAKHRGNVFEKLEWLQHANKLFADAVALEPHNVEVRYLRYAIESNVPAFLGLSKHRGEDLAILQQALHKPGAITDTTLRQAVHDFLRERDELVQK